MATFIWVILSTFVLFCLEVKGIAELTSPSGNLCPGDTLTYTCVTYDTEQLAWKINGVSAGVFNIQTDDTGTSLQLIPGVTVTLTAKDESRPALSSDLIISSAGVDVKVGDVISCADGVTTESNTETSTLSLISTEIQMASTTYINLASARVITDAFVESQPIVIRCLKEIIYEAVPTVVNVSPPSPIRSGIDATFRNLDFCSTNYTFRITPVSINDVNGAPFSTTSIVSGNPDEVVQISDLLVTSTGLRWFLSMSFPTCPYTALVLSWPPQNSLMISLSDRDIPQSLLTEANFPFCVSTNVVISPYLQSLGVVGSRSASNTYTARPLDFSGPSNLRGTPMFTHDDSGIVTGLTIDATWDAVPVGTFGQNVILDITNFDCLLKSSGNSVRCDSTTSHTFTVASPVDFLSSSFGIGVQVNYQECTNLTTESVSETITSLPVIQGGTDGTTAEFRVEVNPSVVADGSMAEITVTPLTDTSTSSVAATELISNSMLQIQLSGLSSETEYSYTVTFVGAASDKLGRTLQGTFRTGAPQQVDTVFFELQGTMYPNNSAIDIADVGERRMALFCRTDKTDCCRTAPNRFGNFYYPNGDRVRAKARGDGFYRTRTDNQHIRLHRMPGVNTPTGVYRCELPDANGVTQNIFIELKL